MFATFILIIALLLVFSAVGWICWTRHAQRDQQPGRHRLPGHEKPTTRSAA
jgi:lipopolysaccharide biosynthesis regulator YciM